MLFNLENRIKTYQKAALVYGNAFYKMAIALSVVA